MNEREFMEYIGKLVAELKPYAKNARKHSASQINQICNSIREFGWTMPILIDKEGMIIAGHARLEAAKSLGIVEVPCLVADGWSEAQKKAYVIADNKLTMNSSWDDALLLEEFSALRDLGFNLELTGFSLDEIGNLGPLVLGLVDPDDVPDPPAEPVTKPGDLWILGSHRLLCGDSTVSTDVDRLLNGVKPHLMVTDPPYGVEYDADWRNQRGSLSGRAIGKVDNDDRADWREAWSLFPGDVAYVWHGALHSGIVAESLKVCGFEMRSQIIWTKNHFAISRGHYHWQHEPCWYAVKGKGFWKGDKKQSTVWQIDKPLKSETGHSTQKPVECMRRPMVNNSSPGQAVYDPFTGSGTSIIAAETEGRICYGMEINPSYVDVSMKRWEDFTGKKAVLENGK